MTQQEFTTRTKVEVTTEEFEAINVVYMNCDLNKDDFCAMWRKMNKSRVEQAKAEIKEKSIQDRKRNYKLLLIRKMQKAEKNNAGMPVCAGLILSDTAKDFLDAEGIQWRFNQWGGWISAGTIACELKKSMGIA